MSYTAEVYKIMIASPGDVNGERNIIREILSEWNAVHSEIRKIVLLPVGWETHSTPEMGERAQAIINKQLKDCDLLIGVFWTRIGTATGEYPSGTVEEIQKHIKAKKPAMLYFSSAPVNPEAIDLSQYSKLQEFKQSCESSGLCVGYSDIGDFRSKFNRQLQLKLNLEPFTKISESDSEALPAVESAVPDASGKPYMSMDAQRILEEVSKSGNGMILRPGWGIQIGNTRVYYGSISARERAAFESAIDELEGLGFIKAEGFKREIFNITAEGYKVADRINADEALSQL